MARLIDAVAYCKELILERNYPNRSEEFIKAIEVAIADLGDMPTIDAVEVVHGRWIDKPTGAYGRWQSWCSVCGKHSGIGGIESNRHKPYCPNCGNPMDGGA